VTGFSLIGQSTVILTADQLWEGRIVEAPQMVLWNDHYWLFLLRELVQPAVLRHRRGRMRRSRRAVLQALPQAVPRVQRARQGPGESSLFSDDNGLWMVYGPWAVQYQTNIPRPVALAHIAF